MLKYFFFFLLFTFVPLFPIQSVHASDAYANSLYSISPSNVLDPSLTLGAPDESMASFMGKDAYVFLDMGEGEEGTGDLTLHMLLLNVGATAQISFFDKNFNQIEIKNILFEIGKPASVISFSETTPYRYVKIISTENEPWKLDSVEAQNYSGKTSTVLDTSSPTTQPTTETTTTQQEEEIIPTQGLLLKLPDDGNSETSVDASVYFIGADGKRHAFPSEIIFSTWFENFDDVSYVTEEQLAAYPLGKNVTVRAGTYLVKIQTDPKVYAVEPGGILRLVSTEEIAKKMYGEKWAESVIDIPDVFFSNYIKGEPLTDTSYANGTLGVTPKGEIVYLANQNYYHLPGSILETMRFDSDFAVLIDSVIFGTYTDAGDLLEDQTIEWPY